MNDPFRMQIRQPLAHLLREQSQLPRLPKRDPILVQQALQGHWRVLQHQHRHLLFLLLLLQAFIKHVEKVYDVAVPDPVQDPELHVQHVLGTVNVLERDVNPVFP